METIITIIIYFTLLILMLKSKLKTSWIVWASFLTGYFVKFISEYIINFLNT